MSTNPCIELHFPTLLSRYKDLVKTGMSDRDAAIKAASEEHQKQSAELDEFKKSLNTKYTPDTYVPIHNSDKIKGITDSYNKKIEEQKIKNEEALKDNPIDKGTGEGGGKADKPIVEEGDGDGYRGISKSYLKKHDDYVKTFESKSDKEVADTAMKSLAKRAEENDITVEQQAENEVGAMLNRKGVSSEQDIVTAAYHLTDLDGQIEKEMSKNSADNTQLDILLNKKQKAMEALRLLANSTGRNLGLFGTLFKKIASDNIGTYRAQIKSIYDVADLPKTVEDLNKSNLSKIDKQKLLPFVTEIEKLTKTLKESDTKSKAKIKDIKDKAVQNYIKKEIAKAAKGEAKLTVEKDVANTKPIRNKDVVKAELDKAREQFRRDSQQMSSGGLHSIESFVKVVKLAVEYGVKSAAEFIKQFKDDFKGHSEQDITKAFNRVLVSDKKNAAIEKISEIAKDENSKEITPNMVDAGLINHVVNDYIHSDTPYDKVISEATKELQNHLPETTESQVRDAILKDGDFKQKTRRQLENEVAQKAKDIKRLAHTQSTVAGIENANSVLDIKDDASLTDKEKKAAIEKRKSDYEKGLDKKIADNEQKKKDAIAANKKAKEEYRNLETERNRQLEKLAKLKSEKERLLSGQKKAEAEKKVTEKDTPEIEAAKKDIKDIEQQIRESNEAVKKIDRERNSQIKYDNKKLETERNRQLQKVADLTEKRDKLLNGIRETNDKVEPKPDTPEIEALKKQISDADKALRETENAQRKAQRDADNEQKKLDAIDAETQHVKNEKTVFNDAIKNPKAANEKLKAAQALLDNAYHEAGIRKETGNKNEIKIAQDADAEIKKITESDLPDDVKKEHIKAIEKNRDEQLNNTKQGVLSNLRDNVGRLLKQVTDYSALNDKADVGDIKESLTDLHKTLKPNVENLKDQIDKADQDLTALIKEHTGTEFEQDLRNVRDKFRDTWQKTSDELQRQSLVDKADASLKESQRRLNGGQYTEIPTQPYQAEVDAVLAAKEAESGKAWAKLNSFKQKAIEENKDNLIDKALKARRDWLIASFGAIEKVGVSAVTKPIFDPALKQGLFGRFAGALTGVKPVKLSLLNETYRQLKNQGSAEAFMNTKNNEFVDALVNYSKTVNDFGEDSRQSKKAYKQVLKKELENSAALAHLFINANSLIDIKQVLINSATNLDASLNKYNQSFYGDREAKRADKNGFEKVLSESGYWLQSVNRTHGAMKSISARQGLIDGYIENLQYFQKRDGRITEESRKMAWDYATLAEYEIGRFGERTQLSTRISKQKVSENPIKRAVASYALPVAKIAINITKQGIDRALPIEGIVRTWGIDAAKGMKANAQDGIEYKNFIGKYYEGMKRGFSDLPYEQKKYINTLLSRGLAGMAQYAVVGALLSAGAIKYGGAWNDNDPFHKKYGRVYGSDGEELKNGEWEFFGSRAPKWVNIAINHSPYSLPSSVAADMHFQINRLDKSGNPIKNAVSNAIRTGINEPFSRLPFTTVLDLFKGVLGGDAYKAARLEANLVPGAKNVAEYFDTDEKGNVIDREAKTGLEMIMKDNPFTRKYLKVKGKKNGGFNEEDLKIPSLKDVAEKGGTKPDYNPEKIITKSVNKKETEHLSDYSPEIQKEYIDTHFKLYKKGIADLERDKIIVYKDKGGTVHLNPSETEMDNMKRVHFKNMTDEEVAYLSGEIKTKATDETKIKVLTGKKATIKN